LWRLSAPEQGSIRFDGNDILDIDTRYLRSKIGYVPQDIFLFSGTVAENISLHHPDATLDEIMAAAKKAGAHGFIDRLPRRYETVLGEHGGGLSGGERQRIALARARALLGSPGFLILDEATSNLDTVSEMAIHNVIKQLRSEHMTVIIIAHRLTTVMNCDSIFVMEQGKVVQQGTHEQLLAQDGLYSEMWKGMTV
jgi:ATP-binding cassette, subfamily C, bacteriocin exporter